MTPFKKVVISAAICLFLTILNACVDNDSSDKTKEVLTAEKFALKSVELFENSDFSAYSPDGRSDSDNDLVSPDVNDAVIIIKTVHNFGYEVKETTINGLIENFYTDMGFKYDGNKGSEKKSFLYTEKTGVTAADLKASKWNLLSVGDLIFTEHHDDGRWDNAMIYLGKYKEMEHAILLASDHHGKVVVVDLEDPYEFSSADIKYRNVYVRRLKYSSFE